MAVINPNSNESTRVLVEERLRLCSGDGMELEALGGRKVVRGQMLKRS